MATACRDVAGRLHDYVDHTLPPRSRRGVVDHLAACPDCRRQLHEIRSLLHLLRRYPTTPAPPRLTAALLTALRSAPAIPATSLHH